MIESYDIKCEICHRETNKIYFQNRKEIKNLIKNINTCLDNNSTTFFLSLFYMDLIFENYSLEEIMNEDNTFNILLDDFYKINHYVLLSLACLIISSKYNERDPHVPDLNSFLRIYNKYSKFYFIFSLNDLMKAEVKILKILKYKLNYYSLYQFITFFFSNGILFEKNIQNCSLIKKFKYSEKKIIEKIYFKSREILDLLIEDYTNYNILFNGKENYITAIEILLWSIENTLKIDIINNNNEQIFYSYYNININYNKHNKIYSIIYNILNKDEKLNKNICNPINNNYNFNYGNLFLDYQQDINKNKNNNLCAISVSNSINDINIDNYQNQKVFSESKDKILNSFNILKNKINNNEYFDQTNEIDKENINILNSKVDLDFYSNTGHKIKENKKLNSISDYMISINLKESRDIKKGENIIKRNELSRNYKKDLNLNERKKNYKNLTKNINNSKNIFRSINDFNEINLYENNGKNYTKDSNYYNIDFIAKKINKEGKTNNKRSLNIEYNNPNKSTYLRSYFNNTRPSPKNILNKTKKIFDKTNKRKINYKNKENKSSIMMINNYINKINYSNNLKSNNDNFYIHKNKSNKSLNNNLSDSNIIYKVRNEYINNKINKPKEEKSKENTIIINNNIQINNYLDRENTFTNYYNNSQQIFSNIENINFENYINKRYFNIDKNNKNISINNIKNKKLNKEKIRKKLNFKKINILEEINEQLKETKNNYNEFNIITKRNKENLKLNKDKNNRILNFGQFKTYFDYSNFGKYMDINYSQEDCNITTHTNDNNSNFIKKNTNYYIKYNNLF